MTASEHGVLSSQGNDSCAVHFERLYDATPDELWRALTDREQLRGWLGHASLWTLAPDGAYELDVGGPARGTFRTVEPGRVLELTWQHGDEPRSLLRFEIVPRERGSLLVLDHTSLARPGGVAYGAGWHAHLDALEHALAGGRIEDWDARYRELRPAYERQAEALGPDWTGFGGTALHEAVTAGDDQRARSLARAQPELRERADAEGLLPSMRALYVRDRALADELLPADERLDVFHAAAFGRAERLAALLRELPERAGAFSVDGFTPLHMACFGGTPETVRVLVEHGADTEAVARNAFAAVRPLGTAAFARRLDCARALLDAGAAADGVGERGFRPLHTAAGNGDVELAMLLLEHGADPSHATDDGRTAAAIASAAGHAEVVALLSAHEAPAAQGSSAGGGLP